MATGPTRWKMTKFLGVTPDGSTASFLYQDPSRGCSNIVRLTIPTMDQVIANGILAANMEEIMENSATITSKFPVGRNMQITAGNYMQYGVSVTLNANDKDIKREPCNWGNLG